VLRFVDVSNNNGPAVDFAKIKAEGAVGVYLKVTEGTSFVDPDYVENRKRAKAAGLKVGGYHFGHPKNNSVAELKFFAQHLAFEKGDLYPVLDLEVDDGSISSRVHAYAQSFLGGLKANFGKAVLYSGQSFMEKYGLVVLPALKWVADYGARPELHWDAWQYTDGQTKYGAPIDGLDTSFALEFSVFDSSAPPVVPVVKKHVKRVWHRIKYVVENGMVLRVGSAAWKWFVHHRGRLLGR
jgi:lysozyme